MEKEMIKIKKDKIYTYTEYNENFINAARQLGGIWYYKENSWVFPVDIKDEIENVMFDIFGYGAEKTNIKIKIKKNDNIFNQKEIRLGGRVIIKRTNKGASVSAGNGVSIFGGKFQSVGGSVNNPKIEPPDDDIIVLIRNYPKNLLHEIDNFKIVENNVSKYSSYSIDELKKMIIEIEKEIETR